MNLINFCEQTFERGGAVFSLPLGKFAGMEDLVKIDGTDTSYRFTDLKSIDHYVRQYVLNHIDLLVNHDNYLNSYISKRRLHLFISKIEQ